MIKFKELLFLKNLKGIGKARIYGKYWKLLNSSDTLGSLAEKIIAEGNFSKDDVDKAIENAQNSYEYVLNNPEVHVITVFDDDYPDKLMVMKNKRPVFLYVKGDAEILKHPNIAVIGTRKPSAESEKFEKKAVKKIVTNSHRTVVSGLALGCDKIAHQTTVDENKTTIAVLPSGVDVITPSSNRNLAENIVKTGGCLISEYEPAAKAFKGTYVERDALIAALSDGTFVVECKVKSGTMHTVEAALKYNRKVMAYLPKDSSKGNYDGNIAILENKKTLKISDFKDFTEDKIEINDNSTQQKLM